MKKDIYTYLQYEWRMRNHVKYQHYFETWFENITDNQIYYFRKEMLR
jgi:hypothetical protein